MKAAHGEGAASKDAVPAMDAAERAAEPKESDVAAGEKHVAGAQTLTGGKSDDNSDFAAFLKFLREQNSDQVMAMDISQRRFITVLDSEGKHVPNAVVEVFCAGTRMFTGKTYANGQTLFCPSVLGNEQGKRKLSVVVTKGWVRSEYEAEVDIAHDAGLNSRFAQKPAPAAAVAKVAADTTSETAGTATIPAVSAALSAATARAAQTPKTNQTASLQGNSVGSDTPSESDSFIERPPLTTPVGDWIVRVPASIDPSPARLDLLFQIDTTGSMHDEIASLQSTVTEVARKITLPKDVSVRWGLVLYADRGDPYLVRSYPFTEDVEVFRKRVLGIERTSGGDQPEAALEALHTSLSDMNWDDGEAIRLIFHIADAPPHLDYGRPYTYPDKIRESVARGIKIYPVAASGLNKIGEYIYRQWAQATMAHFLFITYGAGTPAGGIAGKTPHDVAQPERRMNLDDVIVEAVLRELKHWSQPELYRAGNEPAESPRAVAPKVIDDEF